MNVTAENERMKINARTEVRVCFKDKGTYSLQYYYVVRGI